MTKSYQGLGLSLLYPENWSLAEDTQEDRVVGFTLESPSSAFMIVTRYPWTVTPEDAIDEACEAMRVEYFEVEFEATQADIEWLEHPLQECQCGDVRFYYLDLMVVSRLMSFVLDHRTFLVQIQAEDRDFENLQLVFKAILVSMLKSTSTE